MFVGAINATCRKFLAACGEGFRDRKVVVGCSGNFTSEATLQQHAFPAELHGNDVSLYSCLAGHYLSGGQMAVAVRDPEFAWLEPYLEEPATAVAAVAVLLDALPFVKQKNAHQQRMWNGYRDHFPLLVQQTEDKLRQVPLRLTSFFPGDVFDHFRRFADDPDAVFCCYAPTYKGGYERMYKALENALAWEPPTYGMLDSEGRDRLLAWMKERHYLWYDDRPLPGMEPVLSHRQGGKRTVYLYSNVADRTAYCGDLKPRNLPKWPLAGDDFPIRPESQVEVVPIKTTELAAFKDAFLSKAVDFASGIWAFAVRIDGQVVGFFEYARSKTYAAVDEVYLFSDLAVPGTPHKRLSKLIVMLAVSGQTRRLLEKASERRIRTVSTTAFTERPVSMKYRGVLELLKRGKTATGQPFLQYGGKFSERSHQEVLQEWLRKHAK